MVKADVFRAHKWMFVDVDVDVNPNRIVRPGRFPMYRNNGGGEGIIGCMWRKNGSKDRRVCCSIRMFSSPFCFGFLQTVQLLACLQIRAVRNKCNSQ